MKKLVLVLAAVALASCAQDKMKRDERKADYNVEERTYVVDSTVSAGEPAAPQTVDSAR